MEEQEKKLLINTLDAMGFRPRKPLTKRDIDLSPYSDETRKAIIRAIEANPAMEETYFKIARLAYADGECNIE